MQLSIEEVKKLDSNSYQIIDIRSEEEVAHGAIKGALNIQAEEIESDERVPQDKKLVIVCSRGKTSVDVAESRAVRIPCSWQSCFRSLSITTSLILM